MLQTQPKDQRISLDEFLYYIDKNERISETHYLFPNGDGGDENVR